MSDAISKRLKKSQEFLDSLIERFDLENSRKGFERFKRDFSQLLFLILDNFRKHGHDLHAVSPSGA